MRPPVAMLLLGAVLAGAAVAGQASAQMTVQSGSVKLGIQPWGQLGYGPGLPGARGVGVAAFLSMAVILLLVTLRRRGR